MTIEIVNVSKSFNKTFSLQDVSFTVKNGEVVGYVGLNGAGKTTTIRIAVGVLAPDKGDVLIDGLSVLRNKRKASLRIGWVPELPIFEAEFKALDYFVYLAGYYGYSKSEAIKLGKELLSRFGLDNAMNLKLSSYSQGMKKRFALAVSMINDPENFIFDEVLNGLDPQGIVFFRELAVNFKRKGKAVLFSSHILSEVEDIADRVVFIHRGKIIGEYTVEEIRNKAKPAIELLITKITDDALSTLKKYGDPVLLENGRIVLKNPIVDTEHILTELISRGVSIKEIKKQERSLEEFFFNLIKEAESRR
ncbi:MAG: ABC transporter ATP-binding protein [Desulfurococcaceae archaeon]